MIMRKLIGTIVLLIVLYAGFFGIERYEIKPFILNWFKGGGVEKTIEKTEEIAKDVDKEILEFSRKVQND